MTKFKKAYNLKIVAVLISISFLCTNTLYSYPISRSSLRVPFGQEDTFRRIGEAGKVQYVQFTLARIISNTIIESAKVGIFPEEEHIMNEINKMLGGGGEFLDAMEAGNIFWWLDREQNIYVITFPSGKSYVEIDSTGIIKEIAIEVDDEKVEPPQEIVGSGKEHVRSPILNKKSAIVLSTGAIAGIVLLIGIVTFLFKERMPYYTYSYVPSSAVTTTIPQGVEQERWSDVHAWEDSTKPRGEGGRVRELESLPAGSNPIAFQIVSGRECIAPGQLFYSGLFNVLEDDGKFYSKDIALDLRDVELDRTKIVKLRVPMPRLGKGERMSLYSMMGWAIDEDGLDPRFRLAGDGYNIEAQEDVPEPFFMEYSLVKISSSAKGYILAPMVETTQMQRELRELETNPALKDIKERLDKVRNASMEERMAAVREIIQKYFVYNKYFNSELDIGGFSVRKVIQNMLNTVGIKIKIYEHGTYLGWMADVLETGEQFRVECDVDAPPVSVMLRYLGIDVVYATGYALVYGDFVNLIPGHGYLIVDKDPAVATQRWEEFDPTNVMSEEKHYAGHFAHEGEKNINEDTLGRLISERKWETLQYWVENDEVPGRLRARALGALCNYAAYPQLYSVAVNRENYKRLEGLHDYSSISGITDNIAAHVLFAMRFSATTNKWIEIYIDVVKDTKAHSMVRMKAIEELFDFETFTKRTPVPYTDGQSLKPTLRAIIETREVKGESPIYLVQLQQLAIKALIFLEDYETLAALLPVFDETLQKANDSRDFTFGYETGLSIYAYRDILDNGSYIKETISALRFLLDNTPRYTIVAGHSSPYEILRSNISLFTKILTTDESPTSFLTLYIHDAYEEALLVLRILRDMGDVEAKSALDNLMPYLKERARRYRTGRFPKPWHSEMIEKFLEEEGRTEKKDGGIGSNIGEVIQKLGFRHQL